MGILDNARSYRNMIETAMQSVEDEVALDFVSLFPAWSPEGAAYTASQRVRYNGELYRCLQDHQSQESWTPEAAASLWAKVLPGQGGTEPAEWQQPDSTNPYMSGDRVMFQGKLYESVIDNNVWSPADYPQGWREVV